MCICICMCVDLSGCVLRAMVRKVTTGERFAWAARLLLQTLPHVFVYCPLNFPINVNARRRQCSNWLWSWDTSHSGKAINKDYWEYGPAAGIFVSTAGVFKFSHRPSFSDQRDPSIWVHHNPSLSLPIIVFFLWPLLLPGRQWKPGSGSMAFNRLLFTGADIETRL